jgi:hypothetical protein
MGHSIHGGVYGKGQFVLGIPDEMAVAVDMEFW